ncbi:MAG: hypothetical protein AAGB29_01535 [Planctomycetota bacterium]
MPTPDLNSAAIDVLVDTRDEKTGLRYPPPGLQPYHAWLVDTIYRLAAGSAMDYRVATDDASSTTVYIAPGRASIADIPLAYAGGSLELAPFNNNTALVWLIDDGGGSPQIGTGPLSDGWPGGDHIKLAEVTLVSGTIASILDRRFETILSA